MTDKFLKSLIDKLNANITQELFHLRPLNDRVEFAKVWTKMPKPSDKVSSTDGPNTFYFVKNSNGIYVAVVLDMGNDLHWFVLPKHRRNGHLTNAMKDVILFHLFQDKEEQRITINEYEIGIKNFKASENVAKKLGFIKKLEGDNSEYTLAKGKYQSEKFIDGQNTEISKERINELKKQVNFIARSLWVVQTEIEMKLGNLDYSDELKELVDEVKKHTYRLEDAWWDSKK